MHGRELLAGRYELRGILGRGGMAEVHEGWDTRLNRAVAIKLLYPAFSADPDLRRRFEDEARAAAGLSHPNIVSIHDFGEHQGTPFIVMERLPGETLADQMAIGPMPPQQVRALLNDVLGALAAAHAARIVHRDIKPGNILVAPNAKAMKVADFGIAKTAGVAHTATGQIVGTLAYMSPERVSGAPASETDDLYAVGVVAYEALTGRRPFPQENPASLVRAILDEPLPPVAVVRPDVDHVLAAVVDRAMARDPRMRFDSAEQMRVALSGDSDALFAGVAAAPSARPATKVLEEPLAPSASYFVPAPAPRGPMSRERKLLLAAAAFVGLIVAAVALATDPATTQRAPDPISTSTTVPPPPTTTQPSPSAAPVVEPPKEEKKEEKGERGGGNGNQGNQGGGNKKRD